MNHALLRLLLQEIAEAIKKDTENASFTKRGIDPLFFAGPDWRNMIVGQAPGLVPEKRKEVGAACVALTPRGLCGTSRESCPSMR